VSQIITPYGLCFTFNLPNVDYFLKVNSTSDDFHFKHFDIFSSDTVNNISWPKSISTSINGLTITVFLVQSQINNIVSDIDGINVFVHDPFELPTISSPKFIAKSFLPTEIKIVPEVQSIDDSLVGYSPKE
jgi:hypothetical protein